MAEFEDKLNSILGNQAAMNQIMALARSLSGEQQPAGEASPAPEEPGEAAYVPAGEAPVPPAPDLAALMGQIDPQMIQVGIDVIHQIQSTEDRNAALLNEIGRAHV